MKCLVNHDFHALSSCLSSTRLATPHLRVSPFHQYHLMASPFHHKLGKLHWITVASTFMVEKETHWVKNR